MERPCVIEPLNVIVIHVFPVGHVLVNVPVLSAHSITGHASCLEKCYVGILGSNAKHLLYRHSFYNITRLSKPSRPAFI